MNLFFVVGEINDNEKLKNQIQIVNSEIFFDVICNGFVFQKVQNGSNVVDDFVGECAVVVENEWVADFIEHDENEAAEIVWIEQVIWIEEEIQYIIFVCDVGQTFFQIFSVFAGFEVDVVFGLEIEIFFELGFDVGFEAEGKEVEQFVEIVGNWNVFVAFFKKFESANVN